MLSTMYNYTTKDKKICKRCNTLNSFFKIDCQKCKFKFTKTRADRGVGGSYSDRGSASQSLNPFGSNAINADNYPILFWELLQANNAQFNQNLASQVCEYLEDRDFMCVRDLYKKIKEILSQDNAERIFGFNDTNQLLDLHDYLDQQFDLVLTDNQFTDDVFKDATKKRVMFYHGQQSATTQQHQIQIYQELKEMSKPLVINMSTTTKAVNKELVATPVEDPELANCNKKKREIKTMEKNHQQMLRNLFRPIKYQSSVSRKTLENFTLLQQIGYLEDKVIESNGIKNFVQTFDATCHGLNKKTRGRPKRVDIYYDDL